MGTVNLRKSGLSTSFLFNFSREIFLLSFSLLLSIQLFLSLSFSLQSRTNKSFIILKHCHSATCSESVHWPKYLLSHTNSASRLKTSKLSLLLPPTCCSKFQPPNLHIRKPVGSHLPFMILTLFTPRQPSSRDSKHKYLTLLPLNRVHTVVANALAKYVGWAPSASYHLQSHQLIGTPQ